MPDSEKVRVNLRIQSDTKADWESYADDSPEVNSLSQLIRLAMTQYIATESGSTQTPERTEVAELDSETKTAVNRIERKLDELGLSVNTIQSELEGDSEFGDPKQIVNAVLPTVPKSKTQGPEIGEVGMTASELAGKIGADTSDVASTLNELEDASPYVRRFTKSTSGGEPEQRYVRVEE